MRRLLGALLLALAGLVSGPARADTASPAAEAPILAEAAVVHGGGQWHVDYHLLREARVWVFPRSSVTRVGQRAWRIERWRVETPGVRLERHGRYDVLVGEGRAVPAEVRIAFTPTPDDLGTDYDPALVFTDGSVALYTEQFSIFPFAGIAAAARLPADLAEANVRRSRTRIALSEAGGRVLYGGERVAVANLIGGNEDGTYVLFGGLQPLLTPAMAEILDPQLPQWILDTLNREVPAILGRYAAVLGPAPGPKPTVMVSWGGSAQGVTSMGGSVLPGLVTLAYEGSGVLAETPRARAYGLWFIAHESAHFWLGNAVHYEFSREAWITEGGADLLAFRTVAAVDPDYDWRAALNTSIADCVSLSANRSVAGAENRNEQRAYYACGAVFGLVAEAASRRPFIQFVKALVDDNRTDGTINRAEWLAELDRVSHDPSLSRDIGALLDRGSPDPQTAIASLFTRAGVAFTRGADGMPRMQ